MLVELTPVAGSALPLAALAEHMRLSRGFADDADLNPQIESALRAALATIEARTGKAVFRRSFVQTVSSWSMAERHVLPTAPVAQVDVVRITDRTGAVRVLEDTAFTVVKDSHCPSLVATAVSLPALGAGQTVEIEFQAGFGADWDGVPADLRQAVLMLASTYFGQNEDVAAGFPPGVSALIEPYRTLRLHGAGA